MKDIIGKAIEKDVSFRTLELMYTVRFRNQIDINKKFTQAS